MARASVLNLVGAGGSAVCNFAVVVVVTWGFSKREAGVFFAATSLFLLAANLGMLGTSTGLVYFLSRCRSLGTTEHIDAYVRTAALPVLAVSVLGAAALFILAPELAAVSLPDDPGPFVTYVRVLALFLPLAGLLNVGLSATRGLRTMRANTLIDQLARPALQVVLVLAAALAARPGALSAAWALPYLPAAIGVWLWYRRLMQPHRMSAPLSPPPAVGAQFWRFSAPRSLASVAQVAVQRLDIILVGAMRGPADAAIYAAATRFLVVGQMASGAISLAVQPRLGEVLARAEKDAAHRLYGTSTAWLVAVTWPVYLSIAVFAPILLRIFGAGYTAGAGVVTLLSLVMLVATGCGMVDSVLTMAGRTAWNLLNSVLALAVNIGLDLWLIPRHGILGAAIGWAGALVVANVAPLAQVLSFARLHPFSRATSTAIATAAGCFGVIPWIAHRLGDGDWTVTLAGTVVGTVCYLALLWCFRTTLELSALGALRRGGTKARPTAEP